MHAESALQFADVEPAPSSHAFGEIHRQNAPLERPIVLSSSQLRVKAGSEEIHRILHKEVIGRIIRVSQGAYQGRGIWSVAGRYVIRVDGFHRFIAHL